MKYNAKGGILIHTKGILQNHIVHKNYKAKIPLLRRMPKLTRHCLQSTRVNMPFYFNNAGFAAHN